jgi:hypothetical protein
MVFLFTASFRPDHAGSYTKTTNGFGEMRFTYDIAVSRLTQTKRSILLSWKVYSLSFTDHLPDFADQVLEPGNPCGYFC